MESVLGKASGSLCARQGWWRRRGQQRVDLILNPALIAVAFQSRDRERILTPSAMCLWWWSRTKGTGAGKGQLRYWRQSFKSLLQCKKKWELSEMSSTSCLQFELGQKLELCQCRWRSFTSWCEAQAEMCWFTAVVLSSRERLSGAAATRQQLGSPSCACVCGLAALCLDSWLCH